MKGRKIAHYSCCYLSVIVVSLFFSTIPYINPIYYSSFHFLVHYPHVIEGGLRLGSPHSFSKQIVVVTIDCNES